MCVRPINTNSCSAAGAYYAGLGYTVRSILCLLVVAYSDLGLDLYDLVGV